MALHHVPAESNMEFVTSLNKHKILDMRFAGIKLENMSPNIFERLLNSWSLLVLLYFGTASKIDFTAAVQKPVILCTKIVGDTILAYYNVATMLTILTFNSFSWLDLRNVELDFCFTFR